MSTTPIGLTIFTDKAGRRYADVADLAAVCGLAVLDLQNKFRPDGWGMPRDFRWDGRRMWFALLSLGQLADWLHRENQVDAALKLREWLTTWLAAAIAEMSGAVAPSEEPAHAATARPVGWAKDWEEKHG